DDLDIAVGNYAPCP
ncbi:hypothetical protein MKD33_18160, partial [Chromobacterium piscinae]